MVPWAFASPKSSLAHPVACCKWHQQRQLGPPCLPVTPVHLKRPSSMQRPLLCALVWLFILMQVMLVASSSAASFTGGQASPLTQDSIVIDDGASVATSTASMDDGGQLKGYSLVTARVGSTALIPCNLTIKPTVDDFVTLILWFKDDMGGAPIFTIDARSRSLGSAPHVPNALLEGRASFDLKSQPAFLKIHPVMKEDDGLYKCRIDYRRGRTVSTTTYLTIVVPPERIVILDEKRDEVRGSRIGPLHEDSHVKLICRTEGGRPPPSVIWMKDGVIIDDSFTTVNDRSLGFVVENELLMKHLSRSDIDSVLSCEAINSNLTSRTSATVSLDLSFKPLTVEIVSKTPYVSAGRKTEVTCRSTGSRPPAQLTWYRNKKLLSHSRESFSDSGNFTESVLIFMPSVEDDSAVIECSAQNLRLPANTSIIDQWILRVHYDPIITVSHGHNTRIAVVHEGESVTLNCNIQAKPPVTELGWFYNGSPVKFDTSQGVLVKNTTLTLLRSRRSHAGKYQCWGRNVEGKSVSNTLVLEVHFSPTCKEGQKNSYASSIGETIAISCDVDSSPTPVMFYWIFNSSHKVHSSYPVSSFVSGSGASPSVASSSLTRGQFILPSSPDALASEKTLSSLAGSLFVRTKGVKKSEDDEEKRGTQVSPVNLLLMATNSIDASLVEPAATSSSSSSSASARASGGSFIFPSSSSSSHASPSPSSSYSVSQQLAPTAGSVAQLPLGSSSAHDSNSPHGFFDQIGNNTRNNGTTDSHGDSSGHSTTVTSFTDDKDIEDTLISITSTGNWTIASGAIAAPAGSFTRNVTRTTKRTRTGTSTSNNGNSQGNEVTRASAREKSWKALSLDSSFDREANIAPIGGPIINLDSNSGPPNAANERVTAAFAHSTPVENVNCTESNSSEKLMPQQKPEPMPMVPVREKEEEEKVKKRQTNHGQINDCSKMLPAASTTTASTAITSLNGNSQSLMSEDERNSGRVNSLFTHSTGSSDQVYQSDASSQSLASQAPGKQEVDQSSLMFNHETITANSLGTSGSGGSNKLKYVSEGTRSWLYLTPKSKEDYGVFECWATNVVGKQVKPCVFTVTPVGPPEPVKECTVYNESSPSSSGTSSTSSSFSPSSAVVTSDLVISCTAGHDGGLKQTFMLEIYEATSEHLLVNVSKDEHPKFSIRSSLLLARVLQESSGASRSSNPALSSAPGQGKSSSPSSSSSSASTSSTAPSTVYSSHPVSSSKTSSSANESTPGLLGGSDKSRRLLMVIYALNSKGKSAPVMMDHFLQVAGQVKSPIQSSPSSLSIGTAQDSPVTISLSKNGGGENGHNRAASNSGHTSTSSNSNSGNSNSDHGTSSGPMAGSQATSNSNSESSSQASFLSNAAFLPILGVASGLILTLVLLGVIFTVMHSIRKQERSNFSNSSDPCSSSNVISNATPKKDNSNSCSGSTLSLSKSHQHKSSKKLFAKHHYAHHQEYASDELSAVTFKGSKSSLASCKSVTKAPHMDSLGRSKKSSKGSSSEGNSCKSSYGKGNGKSKHTSGPCKGKKKHSQQAKSGKSPTSHEDHIGGGGGGEASSDSLTGSRSSSSAGFHSRRSQELQLLLLIGGSEALINQTIEQETAAAAAAAAAASSSSIAMGAAGGPVGSISSSGVGIALGGIGGGGGLNIGTGGNLGGAIMTDHCDLTDSGDGRGTLDDMNSLAQLGHVNIFGSNSSGTSEPSQLLDHSLHHSHHHSHLHHSHPHHFHHQVDPSQTTTTNVATGHPSLVQTTNATATNHPGTLLWQTAIPETGDILNLEHSDHITHVLDDAMDERGKLMLTSMLSMNQLSGYATATESAGGSTAGSNACSTPPSHLMDLHHLHDLGPCPLGHGHASCLHQSCPGHDDQDDLESSTGGSCSMQSNAPKVTLV